MDKRTRFNVFAALFVVDLAAPFVLGPFRAEYSLLHDTLSTLGHGQDLIARLTGLWLIVFGLGLAGLTLLEWRASAGGTARTVFFSGLLAFAIGAGVISGLFPEDLLGTPETLNGKIHGICAGLGTIWFLVGLLVGARTLRGMNRTVIGGMALASCIAFAVFLTATAPGSFAGLWQKITLGAGYLAALGIIAAQRCATGADKRARNAAP